MSYSQKSCLSCYPTKNNDNGKPDNKLVRPSKGTFRMADGYLVEIDNQEREHEALLRLVENPIYYPYFFAHLGLKPAASWYLLEIREHYFAGAIPSEIDILAGHLEFESGKIDWFKSTNYVIAAEAKLAFFDLLEDRIKSQKSSSQKIQQIRSKIEDLNGLGFDKVVLLDMIANPPASGQDGSAWLVALDRARSSIDKMAVLKGRLSDSTTAGHWVWSIGSVVGGDERMRGAGSPIELKTACANHLIETDRHIQNRRKEVQRKLSEILSGIPLAENELLPLCFVDCRTCGRIHKISNTPCQKMTGNDPTMRVHSDAPKGGVPGAC